jgi:Zn-dependent M16 (insulinase) family peptidase
MFDILEELICEFDYNDLDRLKNLLLEYRAGMESRIVQNGHRLAILLAARNFSPTHALSEIWHGVHQLKTIKKIAEELTEDKLKSIADDLTMIGKTALRQNNLRMAVIGEEPAIFDSMSCVKSIRQAVAEGDLDDFVLPGIDVGETLPREGWSTASAVSFVASSFDTVRMSHEDSPVLSAVSKLLRSLYLHREIREKGGAYGGMSMYNPETGLFSFASYRDPHIVSTLNVYEEAMSFIKSGNYSEDDVKEAILQVCSEIDKPDAPGKKARKAFYRKIVSLSDEERLRFKEKLLTLERNDVVTVAEKYFDPNKIERAIAVISSEEKIKAANLDLGPHPLQLYHI